MVCSVGWKNGMERSGSIYFISGERAGGLCGGFGNLSMGPISFFLQFFSGILNDLKVLMYVCVLFY